MVHFDLATPLAVLPSVLGSTNLSVPAGTSADPEQPVGSEPFRIRSSGATQLVLERVPGEDVPLDGVDLVFYPDAVASYQAFVAGQLAAAEARYGTRGVEPYLAELFYGFNLKSPTFADRRFRQAVVRAVNRGAIISGVYHESVLPLDNVVVPGIPGYPAPVCGEACRYDPVAARALLAGGVSGPGPARGHDRLRRGPAQEAVAKAIAADLAAVGIPATLRGKPLAAYQAFTASVSWSCSISGGWPATPRRKHSSDRSSDRARPPTSRN
jgi:ABC-type transport system substrate-binding protein